MNLSRKLLLKESFKGRRIITKKLQGGSEPCWSQGTYHLFEEREGVLQAPAFFPRQWPSIAASCLLGWIQVIPGIHNRGQ